MDHNSSGSSCNLAVDTIRVNQCIIMIMIVTVNIKCIITWNLFQLLTHV